MSEAARLNAILEREAPALAACLSDLGRRVAFPQGIPAQSGQAKGTEINATVGQITDGRGSPLPLPALADLVPGLDRRTAFLYSPQDGHGKLRDAWSTRQRSLSQGSTAEATRPIALHGLTQGVSTLADMFADPDTTVLLPTPTWENYYLLFGMRAGAKFATFPFFAGNGFNVQGFADALKKLEGKKCVIVLTFPGNPSGYAPTAEEAAQIVDVLVDHKGPAVALVDDAYQGLIYEPGLMARSMFWDLAERADPDHLAVVKVDGTTKELLFFPGRIGFMRFAANEAVDTAMTSKVKCVGRGTVGSPPGPSQALVLAALENPELESQVQSRIQLLAGRYKALKRELASQDTGGLSPYPFNSGCFALVGLPKGLDPHVIRHRLIDDFSMGTIAIPEINALRVAYCSIAEETVPELVNRLAKSVR
ncbi:MAG: aminotransferase class I/II-fold pyridoxal phosphate-dependent enzyme [Proteobacteria bacterium]|nr:aminotransferase class I/II-fold pyridoxal phosphate-dependent enzyme [Pseudomonadota bacterium]